MNIWVSYVLTTVWTVECVM